MCSGNKFRIFKPPCCFSLIFSVLYILFYIIYYKTYFLHLWKHFILYSASGHINWPVSLLYWFTVSVTPLPTSCNKIMHYLCVFMSQAVQALFVYSVYWNVDMMMMESYTMSMVMILTQHLSDWERGESVVQSKSICSSQRSKLSTTECGYHMDRWLSVTTLQCTC